jgi:adenylate cyclase
VERLSADGAKVPDGDLNRSVDARSGLSHNDIRAQLERILAHREFQATDRMRDFLRFVVEETLAGRSRRLKGYTIATQVFGRGKDFDAGLDPIVRIQAGRLRRALERYYLVAGGRDPIRIDIPKGRYVPSFTVQPSKRTRASDTYEPDAEPIDAPHGPTVALLPLANVTDDPEQSYFVSGLVAELVSEVNRYQDVTAVPCQVVVPAGGGGVQLRDLRRDIGARFLVGGSVRRDTSRIKVAVQLTDAISGRQIWGDDYSVDLAASGLIETQEEIARSVIAAIAGEYGIIARRLAGESRKKRPEELSTYEALLRYHHYMLVMTPEAAESAFAALQRATEREPEYGPAWAGLANLYCNAVVFDRPGFEQPLEIAFAHAQRAAALDPASQLARTIRAYVYLLRGDLERFAEEAAVALALNPNSPNFAGTIGYLYACAGDCDRGRELLESSIALNPSHPKWFYHGLYACHFARREYEDAYRDAQKVGFNVGFWDPALRAAALGKLGRFDEARAAGAELRQQKPDFESRVRELLSYTLKRSEVVEDFLDGLRYAGLKID